MSRCLLHAQLKMWSCVSFSEQSGDGQMSVVDAPYRHFCSLVASHP